MLSEWSVHMCNHGNQTGSRTRIRLPGYDMHHHFCKDRLRTFQHLKKTILVSDELFLKFLKETCPYFIVNASDRQRNASEKTKWIRKATIFIRKTTKWIRKTTKCVRRTTKCIKKQRNISKLQRNASEKQRKAYEKQQNTGENDEKHPKTTKYIYLVDSTKHSFQCSFLLTFCLAVYSTVSMWVAVASEGFYTVYTRPVILAWLAGAFVYIYTEKYTNNWLLCLYQCKF